jgi:ethanolamine utilization protein EutN
MLIGRVVGSVVATQKHAKLDGTKLLLVQPLDLAGEPRGAELLAIDTAVSAGVGDRVLVVQEGKAAQAVLDRGVAAVDAAIVGVVDSVELGA